MYNGGSIMKNPFLVEPSMEYKKSFEKYVLAYKKAKDNYYFNKYKKALENFDEYIRDLHNYSKGMDLQPGEVATSTLWLIDNDEVVGVVRIRHQEVEYAGHIGYDISPSYRNKGYGVRILELSLEKAAKIGIKKAIVNCKIDNIASKKIIEKNNGELLGIIFDEEEKEHLYKYSIQTTDNQL